MLPPGFLCLIAWFSVKNAEILNIGTFVLKRIILFTCRY